MHIQNLIKLHYFVHKILIQNKVLIITKGHNCVVYSGHNCDVYLQKLTSNNPNLDLVKVYAEAKSDQIHSTYKILSGNKILTIIINSFSRY